MVVGDNGLSPSVYGLGPRNTFFTQFLGISGNSVSDISSTNRYPPCFIFGSACFTQVVLCLPSTTTKSKYSSGVLSITWTYSLVSSPNLFLPAKRYSSGMSGLAGPNSFKKYSQLRILLFFSNSEIRWYHSGLCSIEIIFLTLLVKNRVEPPLPHSNMVISFVRALSNQSVASKGIQGVANS